MTNPTIKTLDEAHEVLRESDFWLYTHDREDGEKRHCLASRTFDFPALATLLDGLTVEEECQVHRILAAIEFISQSRACLPGCHELREQTQCGHMHADGCPVGVASGYFGTNAPPAEDSTDGE